MHALSLLADVLKRLAIPYAVGGSLASSARGIVRATLVDIEFAGETTPCPVATAEDILLAKLQWYQAGGSVSERQWNDIAGVLAVNRDLDFGYINMWAARLGVAKLLAKALEDTRGSRS